MLDNGSLAKKAASFKREASKEFDRAVKALIALAFKYKSMGAAFLWDANPELDAEANRICRNLSDTLAERAKAIAREVAEASLDQYDFDEAWDAEDTPIVERLDQQGSLLKELLEIWVAFAFFYGLSQGELIVEMSRFIENPFLSPMWRGLPKGTLNWGRGYPKNIREQIAVIGQNAIIAADRRAEWQDAESKGYEYYIRHRGSSFDCPECDELCGHPIPISTPFEFVHSRCMCYPVYYAE